MNALDSALEALALNDLCYGISTAVNNIWACIAVVTAAISFWKIKASASVSSKSKDVNFHPLLLQEKPVTPPPAAEPEQTAASSTTTSKRVPLLCTRESNYDSTTKGKFFMVCYMSDEDESEVVDHGEREYSEGGFRSECDGWEAVLRVKIGELGWYRYQDLTVLDGNVVRLWDDRNRRK